MTKPTPSTLTGSVLVQQQTTLFLGAFHRGAVCLHPCDTIPGLTANPLDEQAWQALLALKGRDADKPISGLVASFAEAQKYWQDLTAEQAEFLKKLWPAPCTVIAKASAAAPEALVSAAGEIGLRVPRLDASVSWVGEVLTEITSPLPTTSVNQSGTPHAQSWQEAQEMAAKLGEVYVPQGAAFDQQSTVIRLKDASTVEILRQGAATNLEQIWKGSIIGI